MAVRGRHDEQPANDTCTSATLSVRAGTISKHLTCRASLREALLWAHYARRIELYHRPLDICSRLLYARRVLEDRYIKQLVPRAFESAEEIVYELFQPNTQGWLLHGLDKSTSQPRYLQSVSLAKAEEKMIQPLRTKEEYGAYLEELVDEGRGQVFSFNFDEYQAGLAVTQAEILDGLFNKTTTSQLVNRIATISNMDRDLAETGQMTAFGLPLFGGVIETLRILVDRHGHRPSIAAMLCVGLVTIAVCSLPKDMTPYLSFGDAALRLGSLATAKERRVPHSRRDSNRACKHISTCTPSCAF